MNQIVVRFLSMINYANIGCALDDLMFQEILEFDRMYVRVTSCLPLLTKLLSGLRSTTATPFTPTTMGAMYFMCGSDIRVAY